MDHLGDLNHIRRPALTSRARVSLRAHVYEGDAFDKTFNTEVLGRTVDTRSLAGRRQLVDVADCTQSR